MICATAEDLVTPIFFLLVKTSMHVSHLRQRDSRKESSKDCSEDFYFTFYCLVELLSAVSSQSSYRVGIYILVMPPAFFTTHLL